MGLSKSELDRKDRTGGIVRKGVKNMKKRISGAIEFLVAILFVIIFCRFIYTHSGIGYEPMSKVYREEVTYEFVTQTSYDNPRLKETVPVKVIYRYVGE